MRFGALSALPYFARPVWGAQSAFAQEFRPKLYLQFVKDTGPGRPHIPRVPCGNVLTFGRGFGKLKLCAPVYS